MNRTTRRTFIAGGAAMAVAAAVPSARAEDVGLGALATRSGRFFGSALTSEAIRRGGDYLRLLGEECSVWVPEWELKWGALVKERTEAPNFRPVDSILSAAREGGKRVRGHTLVWHEHLPDWVAKLGTAGDWDRFVVPHIRQVAERYRDEIFQWDVVNEAIEPFDDSPDLMRQTPFYRMLGPDYVAEAFRLAHEAAPTARLYLNDYGLCYADGAQERRRKGVLRLLERLLSQGVPVHGFGSQGHLDIRSTFNDRVFRDFVETLAGMGLELAITELDVREADDAAGLPRVERQERAAAEVEKVLAVALDNPALTGVVTWGLADSESWLRKTRPIPDNQGLPYDDQLRPTPMRRTLARLFAGAAKRHE